MAEEADARKGEDEDEDEGYEAPVDSVNDDDNPTPAQ